MLPCGLQDHAVSQVPQPADKLTGDAVAGTLVQERLAKLPKAGVPEQHMERGDRDLVEGRHGGPHRAVAGSQAEGARLLTDLERIKW